MKFGDRFSSLLRMIGSSIQNFIQIWHFYCTMSRGLLFWTQCMF